MPPWGRLSISDRSGCSRAFIRGDSRGLKLLNRDPEELVRRVPRGRGSSLQSQIAADRAEPSLGIPTQSCGRIGLFRWQDLPETLKG